MALKPGRRVTDGEDIGYFMNETAERGIVVVHTNATSGLGEALDDANAAVAIPGHCFDQWLVCNQRVARRYQSVWRPSCFPYNRW